MNSTDTNNFTAVDYDLYQMNQNIRHHLAPVIVYLIVLMVSGIIGNSIVCIVYKSQLQERTSKFFLVYLAVLDLFSCCVCIPFELSDVLLPYTFYSATACKVFRFITTCLQSLSGLTLVCVAYSRYRKIYHPFKELDGRIIKLCVITVVIASMLAAPAVAIFGKRTVQTHVPLLEGRECSTDDAMLKSPVRIVYYTFLMSTFVFSLFCFLTFYILIGIYIMKRNRSYIGESVRYNSDNQSQSTSTPNDFLAKKQYGGQRPTSTKSGCLTCLISLASRRENVRSQTKQIRVKTGRMTIIFCVVTISFVLSFLPYLIANILRATETYFTSSDNIATLVTYNLCVRSTYANSAINPLIYSLLNKDFRTQCAAKICRISRRKN